MKTKEPKHLTFYHSEEAEGPFVGYHLSKSNGLNTSTKGKFIKDETVKAPLLLGWWEQSSDPQPGFLDPDGAKQIFWRNYEGI